MTLHPWPLNDERSTGDHASVLWTGPGGRGLLTDSLAVPLRFSVEGHSPEAIGPTLVEASSPRASTPFNASALFRLRDMSSRFGTGG